MPSIFDRCFGKADEDNQQHNYGKLPAAWREAMGIPNEYDVVNEVEMELRQSGNNFHPDNAAPPEAIYASPQFVPVIDSGARIIGRLKASRDRARVVTIVVSIVATLAGALAAFLTWFFVGGPGAPKEPVAGDKTKDNAARGPASVTVDVLGNDATLAQANVHLVGANAQGKVTQAKIGTWEVTATRMVSFTPDASYDFNTPAEVHYQLEVNGDFSKAAKVTIQYVAAGTGMPDPSSDTKRADFANTVSFDVMNTSGKVVLEKPDASDPTKQTLKDVGVWSIKDSHTVEFRPDAAIATGEAETTIQLDYTTQRSKVATLTIYFNRPVAGEVLVQKIVPGCPAAPIDVVALSAAVKPNTLDAASVKLVGLQDIGTGTTPPQFQIQNQGTSLSAPGEGVWLVSTDGRITFVPESGPNLVKSYAAGPDRTDIANYVGMKFTSAADQTLVRLGVHKASLATGKWRVLLTDATGTELTSSEIDVTAAKVGDFSYGSACYQLKQGTEYYLVAEINSTKTGQNWSDYGAVSLDAAIATGAFAIYGDAQRKYGVGPGGNMYVGVDFTVAKFLGSPTPARYTIADNKKNTSEPARIVLNYGDAMSPSSVNDPSDTSFFLNLRQNAFDPQPPLPLVLLLAVLTVAANMTAAMLDKAAIQTSPITDLDARYTTFKAGATADDLWNVCADIDAKKVDPTGKQSSFYARYWRLRTMSALLDRLVVDLNLK
jgi:hypothetical protein